MKKIIIADDHAVVRAGLKIIFKATSDLRIVDESSTGESFLDKIKTNQYDAAILDLSMPGKDAFNILEILKNNQSELPVVIFTMSKDQHFALRLFQLGAWGFINKEADPQLLVQCMKTVTNGKKFYTPSQLEMISEYMIQTNGNDKASHQQLTDREFQVMYLLASGVKKSEIAQKLEVSANTIDNHRGNILRKLHLTSNSQLTLYAVQQGILQ